MIEVPKEAVIENGYAVYVDEYKGNKYLNIRKIYTDKDTGADAIGKGLTIDVEKADAVLVAARTAMAGK